VALGKWQSLVSEAVIEQRSIVEQLVLAFRETPGGRNLVAIGYDRDLVDCGGDFLEVRRGAFSIGFGGLDLTETITVAC